MGPQSDMPNCISKMMALGMPFREAIARSTMAPAKAIRRFPELGTLGVGKEADIAVLADRDGVFAYIDSWGKKLLARKKIEAVLTVRGGNLVFDAEGRGFPEWTTAGEYEVIQ
jgi:dihydroorotase